MDLDVFSGKVKFGPLGLQMKNSCKKYIFSVATVLNEPLRNFGGQDHLVTLSVVCQHFQRTSLKLLRLLHLNFISSPQAKREFQRKS